MTDGFAHPNKDGGLYHRPYGATRISQDNWQETDGPRDCVRPSKIRPSFDVIPNPEDDMRECGEGIDTDVIPIHTIGQIDATIDVSLFTEHTACS